MQTIVQISLENLILSSIFYSPQINYLRNLSYGHLQSCLQHIEALFLFHYLYRFTSGIPCSIPYLISFSLLLCYFAVKYNTLCLQGVEFIILHVEDTLQDLISALSGYCRGRGIC